MVNTSPKIPKKQPLEPTYNNWRKTKEHKDQAKARLQEAWALFQPSFDRLEQLRSSSLEKRSFIASKERDGLSKTDFNELMKAFTKTRAKKKESTVVILDRKMMSLFLHHDPETTYSLANAQKRFQIINLLNEAFRETVDIAERIDGTTASVRSAVAVLNREVIRDLKLKERLITGSAKAGYCINPKYLLKKK